MHRAAFEAVIPLTGPSYAPQLTKAKALPLYRLPTLLSLSNFLQESYDNQVESALARYNEVTEDPATSDLDSSEDIEVCGVCCQAYQRLCATDVVICLEAEGATAFEEGGGEGRGET